MTQGTLFCPVGPTRTETPTIQERLLARSGDPETSKAAARRVALRGRPDSSLRFFLAAISNTDGMTCIEAAYAWEPARQDYWSVEFNKRVKAWANAGYIRCIGERDGSRVWRAMP